MIQNIIFQTWQTIQDFNKTGIDNTLLYVATNSTWLIPMFLFTIGFILTLSTYFGTKRYTGQGDIFTSFAVAMACVFTLATVMLLKDGLINGLVYFIILALMVISLILLFFQSRIDR